MSLLFKKYKHLACIISLSSTIERIFMKLKPNFEFSFVCKNIIALCSFLFIAGCATTSKPESTCLASQKNRALELPAEAFENVEDLETVDCLLPGIPIRIGNSLWVSPPRPAILSAWHCNVQGGQYALASNKDGRTNAINVWKRCASEGDNVAQNYLGEIYSKSWGSTKPDYVQAAKWFRKAADQGYSRAQNNLGFLYEKGFGVAKNKSLALKLYRQAMGIVVSPIKLNDTSKREITKLESKLDQAMETTLTLQEQLTESEKIAKKQNLEIDNLNNMQGNALEIQTQLENVQIKLAETQRQENILKQQLTNLQPELETLRNRLGRTETRIALEDLPKMGKYYALIIGINDYQFPLVNLKTPVNDAKRIEAVLRQKYGFETTLLIDDKASKYNIYEALIKLSKKMNENDNFLIYFAGHGDLATGSAYWLAQNAESANDTNWISTDDITRKINFTDEAIKARHVLVIADSCYSAGIATAWLGSPPKQILASLPNGVITRSKRTASFRMESITDGLTPQLKGLSFEERVGWIKARYSLPSRRILTSGGLEPVLDQEIRNGLSIFANAFSDVLETNDGIIGAEEIYKKIGPQVVFQVSRITNNQSQTPVYAPLRRAGDNFGEFYFISQ